MSLRLTNIQRFCTGDGPGIRTTLFTKGYSILCPWCANPENLSGELQYYKSDQCLAWNNSCSLSNTCKGNKCVSSLKQEDYERCPITAIKIYGKDWEIEDIESVCLKDRYFYGVEGGITISGGEALLQADELAKLFFRMKQNSIGCCIETSLYAKEESLRCLIEYLSYIYIDFKILDPETAKEKLKAKPELFEANLEYLFSNLYKDKICVRVPLVKGYTCTENNIRKIAQYLKYYKPGLCEIFSVHNLGKRKYETLGMKYHEFPTIDANILEDIQHYLYDTSAVKIIINNI